MQLQKSLSKITHAGAKVYALSYDERDALQDFETAYDISYRLLSDPDSEVIRSFGILNTLIAEDDHPWFGIPFPGTYVVDKHGVITHKFFENNLAVRVGPEQLASAVLGEAVAVDDSDSVSVAEQATADVYLEGESLALSVLRDLVVDLKIPEGKHAYANPAPAGCTEVVIDLDDNPMLVTRPLVTPPSERHSLIDSSEEFRVYHGHLQFRLPMTINGNALDHKITTISGTVRWQTCDDEVCDIPNSKRFELTLPIEGPPTASIGTKMSSEGKEPNATKHFQRMISRREE